MRVPVLAWMLLTSVAVALLGVPCSSWDTSAFLDGCCMSSGCLGWSSPKWWVAAAIFNSPEVHVINFSSNRHHLVLVLTQFHSPEVFRYEIRGPVSPLTCGCTVSPACCSGAWSSTVLPGSDPHHSLWKRTAGLVRIWQDCCASCFS